LIPLELLLTDADNEYILARGDHDRATEVSRKHVRAMGWTEEEIRGWYPPCACRRTARSARVKGCRMTRRGRTTHYTDGFSARCKGSRD
jgi:hypothetical protein